jgi:hypothetical protein
MRKNFSRRRFEASLLSLVLPLTISAASLAAAGEPVCRVEAIPELPDVAVTSVTHEMAPVSHCKVAGFIGTETNFELPAAL